MADKFPSPKDPRDIAPYSYDFADLLGDTEVIDGIPVVTTTDEILEVVGDPFVVGTTVFARLDGGLAGSQHTVIYEIETSEGNRFNRSVVLKIRDL